MLNKNNKIFFFIFFALILYLSFLLIRPYLSVVILALVFSSIFQPIKKKFAKWFKYEILARVATVILISLIVLLPLAAFADITVQQGLTFNRYLSDLVSENNITMDDLIAKTNAIISHVPGIRYSLDREGASNFLISVIKPVSNFFITKLSEVGASGINIITKIVIFIILLFLFLNIHENFLNYLKRLSPLNDRLDDLYIKRIFAMTRAMFKGIFIIAIAQGLCAGLLLWIAGLGYIPFFIMIMIFLSIIPLGVGILTIPIGIILLLLGKVWQGVLVIAGTLLVVSNLDNLLRPRLVSRDAELNPALVLLGVLGGIKLFGFWGIIYGPVILIVLTTTLEIYLGNHFNYSREKLKIKPN